MRTRAGVSLLTLLLAVVPALGAWGPEQRRDARPKPRTRSHHSRVKDKAAGAKTKRAEAPVLERILPPGRWRPEVAEALDRLLASQGAGTPGYSTDDPPVVAFSLEDVVVTGSIGEALFYRLVSRADFKFTDEFWALIPGRYSARARAAYESFRGQPRETWESDPYYRIYRKALFRSQHVVAREWGGKRCAAWRVRLMGGFPESELRAYVRALIDEEFRRPVGFETVEEITGDPDPVKVRVGLRRIQEMEDLFLAFRERGFDVWVMSDAYQWAAEEIAKEYGVHASRVVGVRTKVTDDGMLTSDILTPVPKEAGRAEAATMLVGRTPELVIGNRDDAPLLDYGRGLRILVVEPEEAAAGVPKGKKWLAQPRFSPDRAPQERGHPLPAAPQPGQEGGEAAVEP